MLERPFMRALRYEVRCMSGVHTILPPPNRPRPAERRERDAGGDEAEATDAGRSKRTTIRAAPPPPSASGAPMSEEEEASAPTLPAPAAVLVEGTVEAGRSSILPPPLSRERDRSPARASLSFLMEEYLKKNG